VVTGEYQLRDGNSGGLIDTLSNGTWTAAKAPLPAGAAAKPGAWLRGVACPAPGTCTAVGQYTGRNGKGHGLIETLSGGKWTPAAAPLPADAAAGKGQDASLSAAACTSAGACIAVGNYAARNGASEGLIDTLSNGTWTAVRAPLPADAAAPRQSGVSFSAATCPAADECVAVGIYIARNGAMEGLIESAA
jgi:hypothetical protein